MCVTLFVISFVLVYVDCTQPGALFYVRLNVTYYLKAIEARLLSSVGSVHSGSRAILGSQHKQKSKAELKKLKKYRCTQKNKRLYLQCMKIIDRFSDEENLQECHH
jgi:hypothetical protein